MKMIRPIAKIVLLSLMLGGCMQSTAGVEFASDFKNTHDRIWAGEQYWANPMESWEVKDGRLHCISAGANRNMYLLTHEIAAGKGDVRISVDFDTVKRGANGSVGFRVGMKDEIKDYRAAALRGRGLNVGLRGTDTLFINNKMVKLPAGVVRGNLTLTGEAVGDEYRLRLTVTSGDKDKKASMVEAMVGADAFVGGIALGNNHSPQFKGFTGSQFSFWNWKVSGSKIKYDGERRFGPILWSMHTLSRGVMKLTAQLPPIGAKDAQTVGFEVKRGGEWKLLGEAKIDKDARTARFRIANWDDKVDTPYRLTYANKNKLGVGKPDVYTGTIRKDPAGKTVKVAGFTGNTDYVFPNVEIARNVGIQNPDVLFFSGDQLYEQVGGYGIIRTPADRSIVNYLRKWYMFGWAFGDLMRDRPTIVLPDDHDVYQGNIWGAGGVDPNGMANHSKGGYAQPAAMVNAVHRTQTSHHPDLYDPTPIARGISVYYGDMVYGRVSFAMISDRMFKDGPEGKVNSWKGRPDHVRDPKIDVKALDKPGLKLLGERQLKFLRHWVGDWKGADMKCLLSQTIFCNLANYHGGNQMYLVADLDSNGWPQAGRRRALEILRKAAVFHYAGDQHLASIVQQGIDKQGDAIYSFCVPSIAAGYPRSWRPDFEGKPVTNRGKDGLPNTGDYKDGFGNLVRVKAIANPAQKNRKGLLNLAHDKTSGYGMVHFNTKQRTITMECWRLLFDANNPKPGDQFPGWPKTISMYENDGRAATGYLPEIKIDDEDAVVQVINDMTGDIEYSIRIQGRQHQPRVFTNMPHKLRVGNPETNVWRETGRINPTDKPEGAIEIKLKK